MRWGSRTIAGLAHGVGIIQLNASYTRHELIYNFSEDIKEIKFFPCIRVIWFAFRTSCKTYVCW